MTTEKRRRVPREAVVTRTERLTRDLVRVSFEGDGVAHIPPLKFTDSYIKLLFPPEGADYAWPFDPDRMREEAPRELWPVTRTYTIRSLDQGRMSVDFVLHGDSGLAGPWAAQASPGDRIGFLGPGGAWAPAADADHHLFVGDESAAPAVAAALEALPHAAAATVILEVTDESVHIPLRAMPHVDVRWVHRNDAGEGYGVALTRAVRETPIPEGDVRVFVHGNADMIKDLRRFLFVENGVPRERVSISGYWRTGQDEDAWQKGKKAFVEQMEREESETAWAGSQRT
ncbi:siderophore-interacting protein [Mobilicoccus caccae]|uniref:Siderophore-interacting protein n=1 Tax=Mobilicoccus caccae TaxID=1859295 RepID=A0ABQ6IQ78_9MICO|nr:siderophore-interacting protein [Mobilicoccus caccae]GMA38864.1 siderophore-interacting protein [Mobilicoccus caccae]